MWRGFSYGVRRSVLGAIGVAMLPMSLIAQEVTLTAGDEDLERSLRRDALTISVSNDSNSSTQDVVAAARVDYRRLLTTLYAQGFYGGSISIKIDGQEASSVAPLFAPSSIARIDIVVDPGAAFTFGTVEIAPQSPEANPEFSLESGQLAGSELIRMNVREAIDNWRNAGHAKASVSKQTIAANHVTSTLNVSVEIAPGPRLSFGALNIEGNQNVRTDAIRRIAGLQDGDVFSPQALTDAARRLRQTGAFDAIALLEADQIGPNDTLPITAQITETKPRRFGFGVELSTVTGLNVSSFWMHRNAFGGAENFRIDGEIGSIAGETGGTDYSLGTSLKIPAIYGPDTDLTAVLAIAREDEPDFLLDSFDAEITATRLVRDELTLSFGIGLQRAREVTPAGEDRYTLLTLPMNVDFDKRDDETSTKTGYRLQTGVTPFIGIQGISNGAILNADLTAFRSFGAAKRLTLAGHLQLGSIVGASIEEAPFDFLFYSGGGDTVRGHAYHSLGATRSSGPSGGTTFAGAQLEARYDVTDSIGVVGFFDYGYIGTSEIPGEDGDWHSGAGLGIRYNTGIGPIRLDVGTPASGSDAFRSAQFYLGIGQAF